MRAKLAAVCVALLGGLFGMAAVPASANGSQAAGTTLAAATTYATYYVDNSGSPACSDSNAGTSQSAPWCTVARAVAQEPSLRPGDSILFKCGDVWNEQLDINNVHGTYGGPPFGQGAVQITFGHYGSNCVLAGGAGTQSYNSILPTLNGGSTRAYGIDSLDNPISYVTIDGFRIHDATSSGITILEESCGSTMPGVVIENNVVSQVGAGAYAGGSGPTDPNDYEHDAGIGFTHECGGALDGVHILNNTVWDTGGHNTLRVHGDASPNMLVKGNMVGPGCMHNCIDTKLIAGYIEDNVVTCPTSSARGEQCATGISGLFAENVYAAHGQTIVAAPHWIGNIEYNIAICVHAGNEGSGAPITATVYNNTCYANTDYPMYFSGLTHCDIQKNIIGGPATVEVTDPSQCATYTGTTTTTTTPTAILSARMTSMSPRNTLARPAHRQTSTPETVAC